MNAAESLDEAVALHQTGQVAAAAEIYEAVVRGEPENAEALHLWGLAAHQLGQPEVAIERIARAIEIQPGAAAFYLHLGEAFRALKRVGEARACYKHALALQPDYPEAHNNFGLLCQKQGLLQEARQHYERALALQPGLAETTNNLARLLKELGRIDEAVLRYREAVDLRPADSQMHSNLIFALHFQPGAEPDAIRLEHELWNRRHSEPLRSDIAPHGNNRDADRPLRVGYVSADFRQHPIAFFLYPLLKEHDRRAVEVFAYSSVKHPDAVTAGLKGLVSGWRNVQGVSHADLAALIRADRIDILVDLTMHAADSRLLAFARKPAPVQVSWLSYPGTSGLDTVDYFLTDPITHPPDEASNDELGGAAVRLPDSWCCYHPLGETPPVSPLPALLANGAVTFGCLNNFIKINDAVLARWARLLAAIPDSRLLLHSPEDSAVRQSVLAALSDGGSSSRVEFVGKQGRRQYLETYRRVDIGLDPFPFGGMTTTCEALWMGVPIPAFPGAAPGSRVGASLLSAVGLGELIAHSEREYIALAEELAGDLNRLSDLRDTLRARMAASPLMDGPRFARHVEAAYRQMWREWLARTA